jgi:hypothetical protein
VHFYADLPHGNADAPVEALVLERRRLRKRQWIDKRLELEGVDGSGGCGRVRELVDRATEPGAGNESGERRLS